MNQPTSHSRPPVVEGKRQTVQRHQIYQILEKASGPLTAAQIGELARHDVPDVGMSTVYRTLKMLQDADLVSLVTLPDGIARYEKSGRGPHHFHCRVCGQIWTLRSGIVSSLRGAHLSGGFLIEDHESTFHGQCPNCTPSDSNPT